MYEVINIKNSNMLGRKLLTESYPLFGNNLDLRSLNMDNDLRYMKERWFIEEVLNDNSDPSGFLLQYGNKDTRAALNSKLNFHLSWKQNLLEYKPISRESNYYVIIISDEDENENEDELKIVNEISTDDNVLIRAGSGLCYC
jgi:hypothetical protein